MIIVLKRHASETDIAAVSDLVCTLRYQPRIIRGVEQTVIACIGDELSNRSLEVLRNLPAVESVFPVQKKFKLVSREYHPADSVVNVKGTTKSFKFRQGRRGDWRKAYVTLAEGQSIDVMTASA